MKPRWRHDTPNAHGHWITQKLLKLRTKDRGKNPEDYLKGKRISPWQSLATVNKDTFSGNVVNCKPMRVGYYECSVYLRCLRLFCSFRSDVKEPRAKQTHERGQDSIVMWLFVTSSSFTFPPPISLATGRLGTAAVTWSAKGWSIWLMTFVIRVMAHVKHVHHSLSLCVSCVCIMVIRWHLLGEQPDVRQHLKSSSIKHLVSARAVRHYCYARIICQSSQ